jgi:hypothetical protein
MIPTTDLHPSYRIPEETPVVVLTKKSEIRTDLVARVRQEIEAGVYETPDKLEAALERMFDRLGQD